MTLSNYPVDIQLTSTDQSQEESHVGGVVLSVLSTGLSRPQQACVFGCLL